MATESPEHKAREELLQAPSAALLADYWLATGEAHEGSEQPPGTGASQGSEQPQKRLLVTVRPRPVVREARELLKRLTADTTESEAKQAAHDRLDKRYSLPARAYNVAAPMVVAVTNAPWGVM